MLIDSHCHLDFPKLYEQIDSVLLRAAEQGVGRIATISTHVSKYDTYKEISEKYGNVFFSVGTHPHNAEEESNVSTETLVELSKHPRCIAIGESGLDYHYNYAPQDIQKMVFRKHIHAAQETDLPLIIHAREADDDIIHILEEEKKRRDFKALLHCFSSSRELARVGVELGCYFSFSGILTYKKADDVRGNARIIPHNLLLVETDAPYLAPMPHRSKTNEPSFVRFTNQVLADVIGLSEEETELLTTNNFYRLFSKAAELDGITHENAL